MRLRGVPAVAELAVMALRIDPVLPEDVTATVATGDEGVPDAVEGLQVVAPAAALVGIGAAPSAQGIPVVVALQDVAADSAHQGVVAAPADHQGADADRLGHLRGVVAVAHVDDQAADELLSAGSHAVEELAGTAGDRDRVGVGIRDGVEGYAAAEQGGGFNQ